MGTGAVCAEYYAHDVMTASRAIVQVYLVLVLLYNYM